MENTRCDYMLSAPRLRHEAKQCKRNGVWQWKYHFMRTSILLCKQHYEAEAARGFRVFIEDIEDLEKSVD